MTTRPAVIDQTDEAHREPAHTADKFCILGAGSSGLAVAKNFQEQGIAFDCLEREDDVGGNWYFGRPHSSVYRSTRLISSKRLTEYTDFPMPADYPEHPGHELVWQYLRSYAHHFELYEHIHFGKSISRIEPVADGGWEVTLDDGQRLRYRGVVIANGHNWDPRWPEYPGQFDGQMFHSADYKTPEELRNLRVLVVGGGNSGYDIAVESSHHAAATLHSIRRAYHVLPRMFRGRPIDELGAWMIKWRLPLWLQRLAAARAMWRAWGSWEACGLPKPDHKLFETHPVINGHWPLEVAHGKIQVKPDISQLCGDEVEFADGSREPLDVILCATGYKLSFPFMDVEHLDWDNGRPDLYLNMFHRERDDLFVAGMIQPNSGQFGLVDSQSRLIARYIRALDAGHESARRFQLLKREDRPRMDGHIQFAQTPRHSVEVEFHNYRRLLNRSARRLKYK